MAREDSSWAISEGKDKFRKSLQVSFVEKDESKCITEGLICAQEQDLRASSVNHVIDKTQASSVCRLCKKKTWKCHLAKNYYK